MYPFSQGLPGSIKSVVTSRSFKHLRTSLDGELRTIIGTNMLWGASEYEQIEQLIDDVLRSNPTVNQNAQTLSCILINDAEYPEFSSLGCSCHHNIIAPHVVFIFWPKSDT